MELHHISITNIKKLQTIQNTALHIATGWTQDKNTQHLQDKIKVLPIETYLKLHATQLNTFNPKAIFGLLPL